MPHRAGQDRPGPGPVLGKLPEPGLQLAEVALKGGVERGIDAEAGHIARDRRDVLHGDPVSASRIERELLDLAAARQPVAPEAVGQEVACVGVDRETLLSRHLGQDRREVARLVGVAGEREGAVRPFAEDAERVRFLQVAGLDHDQGAGRHGVEAGRDGGCEIAAGRPDPDDAPLSEEPVGRRFLHQPTGLIGDVVAVQPHELERVGGIARSGLGSRARPFRDPPRVGSVEEEQRDRVASSGDRALDVGRLDRRHERIRTRSRRWLRFAA